MSKLGYKIPTCTSVFSSVHVVVVSPVPRVTINCTDTRRYPVLSFFFENKKNWFFCCSSYFIFYVNLDL